jgi:hypothetical protein
MNALVILLLVSVAIWDVTNIINDYITENRITLVKGESQWQLSFPRRGIRAN